MLTRATSMPPVGRVVVLLVVVVLLQLTGRVQPLPQSQRLAGTSSSYSLNLLEEEQLLVAQASAPLNRPIREAADEGSGEPAAQLEGGDPQEEGEGELEEAREGPPPLDEIEAENNGVNEGEAQHVLVEEGEQQAEEEEPEASGDNHQNLEYFSEASIVYATEETTSTDDDTDGNEDDEEEDEDVPAAVCGNYAHGCCPGGGGVVPAHGPLNAGCCLLSEHGCCPDHVRAALGPGGEGCDCAGSAHGCCPDGTTPRRSADGEGCGCLGSEFGCCQDQHTPAQGPDYAGCPCETFDHGCCSDGVSVAGGPNKEQCPGCAESEFGCCPDNFTPAQGPDMQGCGCEASEHGCCPDGKMAATGPEFQGCDSQPGAACYLPQKKGSCENFSVRWYFDSKEGRCSRFWYGGCEGNANRFEEAADCEQMCVNPPGSARCYLPKVRGICTGNYERYYYDPTYKQCVSFMYGGCLGNANRFKTKLDCEQSCVVSDSQAVCEEPVEPGPCLANTTRWAYREETGQCEEFTYGGCQGNRNRFMAKAECEAACRHKRITLEATQRCKQPARNAASLMSTQDDAAVSATIAEHCATAATNSSTTGATPAASLHARWAFDEKSRRCRPFYFVDCGYDSADHNGTANNFLTAAACEAACPAAFPPELDVVAKVLNIEEGKETVMEIRAEGHPFPQISWEHNGNIVELPSERMHLRPDKSLVIARTELTDAGAWMVVADNGLGKVARRQVTLTVYPSYIPIKVEIKAEHENRSYETGATIRLECRLLAGYPPPRLTWYKNNARIPKSTRIVVEEERTLIINRASPIDSGAYICRATNERMAEQAVAEISVVAAANKAQQPLCQDRPRLANCALIVRARYCARNANLARLCCQSCMEAGQISAVP